MRRTATDGLGPRARYRTMRDPYLKPLLRVVAAARAEQIAPPPEGRESKPYVPLADHFDKGGWHEHGTKGGPAQPCSHLRRTG